MVTAETQDDAGNTAIRLDYRVLQPDWVTDPNGNRSRAAFDAMGMVVGTAVRGKPGENLGDSLDGFEADLLQRQIDRLHDAADPHVPGLPLLANATTRIVYDLDRFRRSRLADQEDPVHLQPAYAATIARETHASEPMPAGSLRTQIGFSYSDGFGREIQRKIQAEPGPVEGLEDTVDPRWVGSGWTIFNNKGKPVRQYEPFFSRLAARRHQFEFGAEHRRQPDPVLRSRGARRCHHASQRHI